MCLPAGLNSPSTESSAQARPSTPSRLAFFIRQQNSGGGSGGGGPSTHISIEPASPCGTCPSSVPMSADSPMHQQQTHTECLDWDSGYLEYLKDAQRGIEFCSWGCRDWSAPYDGENPSPNKAPPPPPPPSSNPSLAMFSEHFSFLQGGSSNTPPGQKRAAIVAVACSEWSSSERDSGEWDVTIGKNNCISLTPQSKKRSLQREELLPKPAPCLVPSSSSSTPSLVTSPPFPPAPLQPTSAINVTFQALLNGTMGQEDGCSDSRERGLEAKKVKRDLGEQQHFYENADQNGSLVTCPSQSCTGLPQSIYSQGNRDIIDAKSLCPKQILSQSSLTQQTSGAKFHASDNPDAHSTPTKILEANQGLQSVESLIEELLEQTPGDHQLHGDSNGQGISIEAFTQELRELEDRVKERSRAAGQQEDTSREFLSTERQGKTLPSSALEPKLTGVGDEGEPKEDSPGFCSPARPLNLPASQPYTGEIHTVDGSLFYTMCVSNQECINAMAGNHREIPTVKQKSCTSTHHTHTVSPC